MSENITAIAYNSKTKECCLIKSKATYDMLKKDIELYNVKYTSTNWGGRDDLSRAEKVASFRADFSESFDYHGTLKGSDFDMGHEYPWKFEFDKIVKVKMLK